MNHNLDKLKRLENNVEVKNQFFLSLKRAKPSLGVHTMNQVWRHAINAVLSEVNNIYGSYQVDWESVKQTVLLSAEYGLSFDARSKEAYIEVQSSPDNQQILTFQLALKYNGMKHRLVKACGVRMLTTEVVYENDTFEWRGQWKEPLYIMANEKSDMQCCFGMVKLKNGDIMAYKLDKEELLELERADIERAAAIYNDPNASFYMSPYRKRMFEIATLRYLYGQLISMFDEDSGMEGNSEFDKQQDIASALEAELNAVKEAG
jgi:hypothetical protein